jgi:hypothetical protein
LLVKKILKSILIKIQKNIPRIIGKSMDKKIRYNDYHFFSYIHQQNLKLISLNKIKSNDIFIKTCACIGML